MNARLPGDISESDLFMQRGCAEKTLPIENNENRSKASINREILLSCNVGVVAVREMWQARMQLATQLDKLEE